MPSSISLRNHSSSSPSSLVFLYEPMSVQKPPMTTDNRRRKGREVAAAIFAETQFFTLLTSNSTSSG
ncbi:hypothetical protein ACFX1R_028334 [Malus domestica]